MSASSSTWDITSRTGYRPLTTYWQDFSIAEKFGESAVKDTYRQQFHYILNKNGRKKKAFVYDYKYLTELVMVLNHKMWSYWDSSRKCYRCYLGPVFQKLYETASAFAERNLKGDELDYFYITTD